MRKGGNKGISTAKTNLTDKLEEKKALGKGKGKLYPAATPQQMGSKKFQRRHFSASQIMWLKTNFCDWKIPIEILDILLGVEVVKVFFLDSDGFIALLLLFLLA